MKDIGYPSEQFVKMVVKMPAILALTTDNIEQKKYDIQSLGYADTDVVYMTEICPAILCIVLVILLFRVSENNQWASDFLMNNLDYDNK